ncbi:hypothetical protein [Hymenobacter lapidarius]|nr:hypothetical protein [Hymenobacter lapidarius]
MKPTRLETLLYAWGALLVLGGTAARIGHLITGGQGYAVLLGGIALSIWGRRLTNKRTRQLQQENRELKAQLSQRRQKP